MSSCTRILVSMALLWTGCVMAIDPLGFEDAEKQERYQTLLEELRCLVCQNESLASSSAGLAGDLRREVHRLVDEGRETDEIKTYLVERYGEFVLYRPQVSSKTWLLWFGPILLVLAGGIVVLVTIRRRSPLADETALSDEERQRLNDLLRQRKTDDGDSDA